MTDAEVREIRDELTTLRQLLQQLMGQVENISRQRPVIVSDYPNIVRVADVQGGEPMIRDKYVPVGVIVALIKQGQSAEEIVDDYDGQLTLADIYDALSYYYTHQTEIEGLLTDHEASLAKVSGPGAARENDVSR